MSAIGFTHYWYREKEIPLSTMEAIVNDVKKLHIHMYVSRDTVICGPLGEGNPQFDTKKISFNGNAAKGEDHETFEFERVLTPSAFVQKRGDKYFQFTKTASKPYDIFVCAVLLVLKRHLRDHIKVMSDGDMDDGTWETAVDAVNGTFHRNDEYTFDEGELKVTFDDDNDTLFFMMNVNDPNEEIPLDARELAAASLEALNRLGWTIVKHED